MDNDRTDAAKPSAQEALETQAFTYEDQLAMER